MVPLAYGAATALVAAALLAAQGRRPEARPSLFVLLYAAVAVALGVVAAVASYHRPVDRFFGALALLAVGAFAVGPLYVLGAGEVARRAGRGRWAAGLFVLGGLVLAFAADAFLVEPHWLEVSRVRVPLPGLAAPVRAVVVADLQTADPGDYERRALRAAAAEEPDLWLFAGDYLQAPAEGREARERRLARMIHDAVGETPGVAVAGDVDGRGIARFFAGTRIVTSPGGGVHRVGPLTVTALSLAASSDPGARVAPAEGPHLALGHRPDFARGDLAAPLAVAGHTHGGQVRLPWLGPLITMSTVPRSWAAGVTRLSRGGTLVVSRGIGMERGEAPPLRFGCRPEVVVLELVPSP